MTWVRHSGRYTIQANYTYQKALGIVAATYDPYNLAANYGVLPSDRRHLFNIAYSLDEGNLVHSNHFVNGAANGWQLSGILTAESGANLTYGGTQGNAGSAPNTNYNMDLYCQATAAETAAGITCPQGAAVLPGTTIPINNQSILGSNAPQLNPIVTCNPTANLGPHQYVNGNCFAAPTTVGTNGPTLLPVAYGPVFFTWDMSLFKNFQISESKKLQFRVQAYNWLNHPLYSFPSGSNLTLQFAQDPVTQQISQVNSNFGYATQKQGARIIELAVKFFF
jgi:hypothetical protein